VSAKKIGAHSASHRVLTTDGLINTDQKATEANKENEGGFKGQALSTNIQRPGNVQVYVFSSSRKELRLDFFRFAKNTAGMNKLLSVVIAWSSVFFLPGLIETNAIARQDTLVDSGWTYKSGEMTNAEQLDFDASDWESVSMPHNWGWEQAHAGKPYYRGPGWYRCELKVEPQPDRRYFLRFEAASTVADVYLNGVHLGQHRGGFGAFAFEITTNLTVSGINLLAVRVSNAPEPDIAPLSGDFNVYGGLYRPVHLIETAAENFAVTDHASPGVAWLETSVSETQAVLDVTAQISNGTRRKQNVTVVTRVLDAAGNEVVATHKTIRLMPGDTEPSWSQIVLSSPHLWSGRKNPYLYRAIVELHATNELIDAVEQPLGLRSYYVDPDKGFFLNGRLYPIYGVCRHQDRPEKGWAISKADMEEDVRLMKELGVTAVRCAHYEHSDYFYSLCDRAGILVWAEIPQVDEVRDTPEFENTSRGQLLDLIRQNVNHPSIFVWSLFNEIGGSRTDDPHRELQDLNNVAHGEDPTRPTIGAANHAELLQMTKIPDLIGWNNYPGWYGGEGSLASFGAWLDEMRDTSRHGGFCLSEYGAGANTSQHEDNPRQPKTNGQWHPEEWQAIVHEADWAAIKSHPFVWGSFAWNMFDFCALDRNEGGQIALNDKGLVTYDRKIKKDAFYFYQANWSPKPVLYITSRRFNERTNAVTNVKIYSNAGDVELLVNGVSQGSHSSDGNDVFTWSNIQLAAGQNRIEAKAERDGQDLSDSCAWNYSPPK
jgi:beta-galactosidase